MILVPGAGLEPARPYGQGILSPQRLPFRHPGDTSHFDLRLPVFDWPAQATNPPAQGDAGVVLKPKANTTASMMKAKLAT